MTRGRQSARKEGEKKERWRVNDPPNNPVDSYSRRVADIIRRVEWLLNYVRQRRTSLHYSERVEFEPTRHLSFCLLTALLQSFPYSHRCSSLSLVPYRSNESIPRSPDDNPVVRET